MPFKHRGSKTNKTNPKIKTASKRGVGGGKGRRRIEIKKIKDNKTGLIVTFSKRRSGLFKKVMEFCNMCGVEATVITFSPSGRPFSFGKPSPHSVVLRFLSQTTVKETVDKEEEEVEEEEESWWEKGTENLDVEGVKEYTDALSVLKSNLVLRIEDLRMRTANTRIFF